MSPTAPSSPGEQSCCHPKAAASREQHCGVGSGELGRVQVRDVSPATSGNGDRNLIKNHNLSTFGRDLLSIRARGSPSGFLL